ncbi:hypothetical protein HPP92_006013 [Vanilla planifolia]|uniref:Uncharacterized protein n=1 Tax=Vanilla planifolia TaxID=51239 RepID=A0A835RQM1_VANPL|nr:hypothetical protein HPP92_006013 [Vanilla planifolia]
MSGLESSSSQKFHGWVLSGIVWGMGGKGESLERGMGMEAYATILHLLVDKSLQSMEAEAERLFKEERSLLFEDDVASKRDSMFEKAEFIESELKQMTEQIKSIIQTFNAKQVCLQIITLISFSSASRDCFMQGVDMDLTDNMTPIDAAARILNS